MTPDLADATHGYLTTTGRVSGRAHRVEIWFAVRGDTIYLLSGSGGRSDWCRNLRADPEGWFTIDGVTVPITGRRVTDPAEDAIARSAVFDKYRPRYAGDLVDWRDGAAPYALDIATDD